MGVDKLDNFFGAFLLLRVIVKEYMAVDILSTC